MYVGQNLFMSSVPIDNVANGVKAWISEEKNYDFNKLECRKEWWHCGHLTQVLRQFKMLNVSLEGLYIITFPPPTPTASLHCLLVSIFTQS